MSQRRWARSMRDSIMLGHRTAEGADAGGELALGEAAFGAEDFDSAGGPYSGRSDFQGSCCHGSICSFHSPVWLTGDRRLCCARRTAGAYLWAGFRVPGRRCLRQLEGML